MKKLIYNGEVFALLSGVIWGLNYPNTKLILARLSAPEMLLIRFSAAATLMLVYLCLRGERLSVRKSDLGPILILGLVCVGVYNVIWTNGIRLTSAANAALLISCAPIFTTLYTAMRGEEVISVQRWCGVLLAFGGIFLITLCTPGVRLRLDSQACLGNLLCLAASLIFAAYNILAKPLLKRYSPEKLTGLVTTLGLFIFIPYGVWNINLSHLANAMQAGAFVLHIEILYLILMATVVAYFCWYRGVQGVGAARTVLYHYLVPVISMIMGMPLLKEYPSAGQLLGAGLVLGGLLITRAIPTSYREAESPKP